MDLQNSAVGGVAGRVPSWINRYRGLLADMLEEGVTAYIAKNTDPYVLDNAPYNIPVCFSVSTEHVGLYEDFPDVPCLQKLKDSVVKNQDGRQYKEFPLELFEERYALCAGLLVRLVKCSDTYMSAGQKMKKQIFQTLFSSDTEELNELLEDEA